MKVRTRVLITAPFVLAALLLSQFAAWDVRAQQTDRAKMLGKKLMCMCGCNQVLTACNHVGCTVSSEMLKKLDLVVARNEPDDLTLQSFVQEYGLPVLAEPPTKGFNSFAWYIPGLAFAVGLAIVLAVIAHWRRRVPVALAGPDVAPEVLARVRRQVNEETED